MIFHNQYNMDTNQSEEMLAIALKRGLRDPMLCGLLPLFIGFWGGVRGPRTVGRVDNVVRGHWWGEGNRKLQYFNNYFRYHRYIGDSCSLREFG